MKVLLVGANHGFLEHMSKILAPKVEEIGQATNEMELETCLADSSDVALIDLFDLKAKGIDFMHRIKTRQPLTQIICLIPKGEIKLSIRAMRNGAFDELQSPFSWPALLSKLEEAWREKKLQENKRGFWRSMQDHLTAGSLAQLGGAELGRKWLDESKERKWNEKPVVVPTTDPGHEGGE